MVDHYQILGVSQNATYHEIRTAYRSKAREVHPDKTGDTTAELFLKVSEAYQVLNNPISRQKYDAIQLDKPGSSNGFHSLFTSFVDHPSMDTVLRWFPENEDMVRGVVESSLETLCRAFSKTTENDEHGCSGVGVDRGGGVDSGGSESPPKTLHITYDLEDHYHQDFYKEVVLTSGPSSESNTYQVDTRIPVQKVTPEIYIRSIAEQHSVFHGGTRPGDLIHIIPIQFTAFYSGFEYTLDLFGKPICLFFKTPYIYGFIYYLRGSTNLGRIFFKLELVPEDEWISLKDCPPYTNRERLPEPQPFELENLI